MTRLTWRQVEPGVGEIVLEDGLALARYVYVPEKNHPHFRDVRPLDHAGIVTTSAPWDHRWHHGLWWSWKFINDVLYWEDHSGYGGIRDRGLGRTTIDEHSVDVVGDAVVITELLRWNEIDTGITALTETRTMTVRAEDDSTWFIDWDHQWTAALDARLDTTSYPENWWGGYAGLNYRAARSMAAGETIVASGGREGRNTVHGESVEWAGLFGRVDGSGDDEPDSPAMGGVALFGHPANAGGPAPAYVFSAADEFGFLAAAPLMHSPLVLPAHETHRLRYRTAVFGRLPDRDELELLSTQFANTPSR